MEMSSTFCATSPAVDVSVTASSIPADWSAWSATVRDVTLTDDLASSFAVSGSVCFSTATDSCPTFLMQLRIAGDPTERARKAVTLRIRAAIETIAAHDEPLARHLRNAVKTGRVCSYDPESPVAWHG